MGAGRAAPCDASSVGVTAEEYRFRAAVTVQLRVMTSAIRHYDRNSDFSSFSAATHDELDETDAFYQERRHAGGTRVPDQ